MHVARYSADASPDYIEGRLRSEIRSRWREIAFGGREFVLVSSSSCAGVVQEGGRYGRRAQDVVEAAAAEQLAAAAEE